MRLAPVVAVAAVSLAALSATLFVSTALTPAPTWAVSAPSPLRSAPSTFATAREIWQALHGHGLDCGIPADGPARDGATSVLTCGPVTIAVYRDFVTTDAAYARATVAAAGLDWVVTGPAGWVEQAAQLLGGRFREAGVTSG